MPLKITLKPNERMILGGAVVRNPNKSSCSLAIENKIPILREKDIMTECNANSICSQIYFSIQLMYIDEENISNYQHNYWLLVKKLLAKIPALIPKINQINEKILNGNYYFALKLTRKLINYEKEVISRV